MKPDNSVMNMTPVKIGMVLVTTFLTLLSPMTVCARDRDGREGGVRVWHIKGIPTTGPNDVCGEPVWQLPAPFPPRGRFTFLGEYDSAPGATDAIPLSSLNCKPDTILATTTDKNFLTFLGFPDVDTRLKNIRLREIPVIAGLDGVRANLPTLGQLPPNALPPTRSTPNNTITLGDWLKPRSSMTIRCFPDETATVRAKFENLVPNGVYGLYGIWKTTPPGAS